MFIAFIFILYLRYEIQSEYICKDSWIHGVTMRTVWNWINKGELEIERTSTGRIRIVVDENKEKTIAVYARVSSSENKSNLIAQKDRVVSYCMAKGYKISKVVMEVGSGLNDKRPKLENLLKDN